MCSIFRNRKVRSFPLYNSAQYTMCHLRAFSSQTSLCPQWCALLCWRLSPVTSPSPVSGWHLSGLQRCHRGGAPGLALLQQRHPCSSSEYRCAGLGPSSTRSPPNSASSEPLSSLQACHPQWYILTLWNSNLFVSYWPFAAWVINYEISLMVFEM